LTSVLIDGAELRSTDVAQGHALFAGTCGPPGSLRQKRRGSPANNALAPRYRNGVVHSNQSRQWQDRRQDSMSSHCPAANADRRNAPGNPRSCSARSRLPIAVSDQRFPAV